MTAEQALEIITNAVQTEHMTVEQDKALAIVQKNLEKQIPKKPADIKTWAYDTFKGGKCCACGTNVNSDMNYCNICGQAFDWSFGWNEEVNENV